MNAHRASHAAKRFAFVFPDADQESVSFCSDFCVIICRASRAIGLVSVLTGLLRKEVIQPLVLERLPCYDFTPIIEPTFGRVLQIG